MNTIREHWIETRDGVRLYTLVQLPEPGGRFPLIICRSPYASQEIDFDWLKTEDTHGYAVLYQHCRGTGKSEGVFLPYCHERNDGLDLLDWIRKQPFYNGELFLHGGSYLSSVHFSYLNTDPADIKAAYLPVQDTERYNILYRNGFLKFGLHGKWVLQMYKRNEKIERNYCEDTLRTLPLCGITRALFNEYVPEIEEEILHPDPKDPFWQTPAGGSDYQDACAKCNIPILLATAFYDIYTEGIFNIWKKLTPERRKNCALVITPFDHNYNPEPRKEPSDLPDFENGRLRNVCPNLQYIWFDHFRKGTPLKFIERGKITYYTLFENQWHTREMLENAPSARKFYLHADRTLQTEPQQPGSITYLYNPYAPAPFAGGVCNNFGGMQVQAEPNSRYDILSFLSETFEREMICEGKFEVELHCRSTAPDTCFYVRLMLVRNHIALSLRDDIDSLCRIEKEYIPNEERILRFTFAEHSFKILPGDRLRLDVSSSCVPHFQVHTNRKGLLAEHTQADICRNTVITGKSFFTLFCQAETV